MKFVDEIKQSIKVNKQRLLKEYAQTKEAIGLIKKSFTTKLSPQEKAKVKEQLPDVLKVLVALGIFALPFGSVLLLLWIRFVPKMLPSAFRE